MGLFFFRGINLNKEVETMEVGWSMKALIKLVIVTDYQTCDTHIDSFEDDRYVSCFM